ncbi:Gfo/Idh/MocA family protein [Dyadobacter chenhuakuii]|uniref:Gfo/Idh/MocA family oxidoreductase n=1 Tax=Dyadobacter chenhuakuii TaxID=2909339 RepID=A0ABY4XNL6_9BACT|nr:Gfo/Idh/MocA family oxidoreductase [Dyadobacter chenhuakuii]MCF2494661.1 Gfo/Idh/MocA family oxidoreductase [Dyadobacter chenhuakuii]USJ32017.1 Gfo/Idh/MocA family oxidoreductase [Dyadobacter chenhuakuii]
MREPLTAQPPISRKGFLTLTGRYAAIGAMSGLAIQSSKDAFAQAPLKATSPPARVPAKPEDPIVLEKWKSEYDQQSAPTPTPLPPDQRVGYAVVGLGHLSLEEILPALGMCKKSKLAALVSGSPEKMKKVAAQYGVKTESCYSYETYDQLKENKEVDVIYIVLPNGLHKEYVVRGAKAGKHILCEKPMANTAEECKEMIAACNKANVKLMIAYRIQYQPHNRKLREILQKKEFGPVKVVEASNCQSTANPDHWRHKLKLAGGGVLPDIGLYCLNTTRFILGEEPTEVFAYQYSTPGNPLFTEVEEFVSWQMRFSNGIIANCTTHYNVHESRRYRVLCEKGWLNMDRAYAYKGQDLSSAKADGRLELHQNIGMAEVNQFATEMDHFSDCVINNKKPFTPGEEGLQDHIIMEAIYKSAREGKPVKINSTQTNAALHGPEPELG